MPERATVREWTDAIRRSTLDRTTKGVALILASYADWNGSRVFPGLARLAVAASVHYNTAKAAMGRLMECELLECVGKPSPGRSAEYRLCFGDATMDRAGVRSPDEMKAAIAAEDLRRRGRRGTAHVPRRVGSLSTSDVPRSASLSTSDAYNGVHATPPHIPIDLVTRSTSHDEMADLDTAVTVVEQDPSPANDLDWLIA